MVDSIQNSASRSRCLRPKWDRPSIPIPIHPFTLLFLLLSLTASTTSPLFVHASPVVAATGGPLGAPPGNPPGTIPAGSGSGSSTSLNGTVIIPAPRFQPGVRALDTTLAVLCVILTTTTYAVLIGPGTRLLSTSKLPLLNLEANIGNLLSRAWPDSSGSSAVVVDDAADATADTPRPDASDAIRLLYVGRMDGEEARAARGVDQCRAVAGQRIPTPSMWLTTGSSLTKSMVQLAVWEWISVWTALAMIVSTLAFNGFLTGQPGPDSYPRLVIVMVYAASFAPHAWYVWRSCRGFFTLVAAGASWSLLHKASFASADLGQLAARLDGGPTAPLFKQVGKPAASSTFPVSPAALLQDVGVLPIADGEALTDAQKSEASTVGDWQQRDIRSTVESGKTALEGVVANVMTMVGIIITTGFSVWTTMANSASETSQLGSLALLASLTIGAAAMFSSAVDLSVMLTSFQNVLFLKEVMINGEASAHVQKRASNRRVVGFTHKTVNASPVRMTDLTKMTAFWPALLFGPGYAFLPSVADHERESAGAKFELHLKVRGKSVLFTTAGTDRHNTKADGSNVESINVCYEPAGTGPEPQPNLGFRQRLLTLWRNRGNRRPKNQED